MRKLYITILFMSTLILSSFNAANENDHSIFADGKVTHFYPNPATTYINFTFDKSIDKSYSLQIFNFMGRKMSDTRITEPKITISLDDNFLRGLYIYQLRDQSGRIIESGKFQVSKYLRITSYELRKVHALLATSRNS
jgi:hypothetical protein